jgi:hypothetical protein
MNYSNYKHFADDMGNNKTNLNHLKHFYDGTTFYNSLNNIWVYLNKSIKFHKPIHFNINDEVTKSF